MIILNAFQFFMVTVALCIAVIRYFYDAIEVQQPRWLQYSSGPTAGLAFGSLFTTYFNMLF